MNSLKKVFVSSYICLFFSCFLFAQDFPISSIDTIFFDSLYNQAWDNFRKGEYTQAKLTIKHQLKYKEYQNTQPSYYLRAQGLLDIINIYTGEFYTAYKSLDESFDIMGKYPEKFPDQSFRLNEKGELFFEMGQYESAAHFYKLAYDAARNQLDENKPNFYRALRMIYALTNQAYVLSYEEKEFTDSTFIVCLEMHESALSLLDEFEGMIDITNKSLKKEFDIARAYIHVHMTRAYLQKAQKEPKKSFLNEASNLIAKIPTIVQDTMSKRLYIMNEHNRGKVELLKKNYTLAHEIYKSILEELNLNTSNLYYSHFKEIMSNLIETNEKLFKEDNSLEKKNLEIYKLIIKNWENNADKNKSLIERYQAEEKEQVSQQELVYLGEEFKYRAMQLADQNKIIEKNKLIEANLKKEREAKEKKDYALAIFLLTSLISCFLALKIHSKNKQLTQQKKILRKSKENLETNKRDLEQKTLALEEKNKTIRVEMHKTKKFKSALEKERIDLKDSVEHGLKLKREISHRVKNHLQTLASTIKLQMQTNAIQQNKVAFAALGEARDRVQAILEVHNLMVHRGKKESIHHISLERYFKNLTKKLFEKSFGYEANQIDMEDINLKELREINIEEAKDLGMIITELALNVNQHAYREGERQWIQFRAFLDDQENLNLIIADRGKGGFDFKKRQKQSFGLELVETSIERKFGGVIYSSAYEGKNGTQIIIKIPFTKYLIKPISKAIKINGIQEKLKRRN